MFIKIAVPVQINLMLCLLIGRIAAIRSYQPEVYTITAQIEGQLFHIGIERVHEGNQKSWETLAQETLNLTVYDGILYNVCKRNYPFGEEQRLLGFDKEGCDQFMHNMQSHGFGKCWYIRYLNTEPCKLKAISPGDWVAYASTEPITGEFQFQHRQVLTLKDYMDKYPGIVALLPTNSEGAINCFIINPGYCIANYEREHSYPPCGHPERMVSVLAQYANPDVRNGIERIVQPSTVISN